MIDALWGVQFFLAASLVLYVLLGGADFGAGILELFLARRGHDEHRRLISKAMAPVWEANHMWLILAIVIVFMGFPELYVTMSTYLHLPLIAVLLGIVARGCAFTFRYYDTPAAQYYQVYTRVFAGSSLWTAFFLGVVAAALSLGRIQPSGADYGTLYIWPWLNWYCIAFGIFVSALFAFLASVYLAGEAKTIEMHGFFRRRALVANWALLVVGAAVFVAAYAEGFALSQDFFRDPISLTCFGCATALWIPFWFSLRRVGRSVLQRVLAVAIVSLVMVGWFAAEHPVMMRLTDSTGALVERSVRHAAAPVATLRALLGALIVGGCLIFPALFYLLRVFKWETLDQP